MSKELENRIEAMREKIEAAQGAERDDLLEHLEEAVTGLEGVGAQVPAWAHEILERRHEDESEDGFDNMPV